MNLIRLFKKKELPTIPPVNKDTETPQNNDTEITTPEESRVQYAQIRFPDGIVIAEEPILVIPQMIDDKNRYPAYIFDNKHNLPPTVIGIPIPMFKFKDLEDCEDEMIKKASQYDIRIAVALSDELPNIDEKGNKILDKDWNDSVRLYIRPIFGTEGYQRADNPSTAAKLYYISNENIQRQIAVNEG